MEKLSNTKKNRFTTILNILRKEGPSSRKTLAEKMDLTRASLTLLTNPMLEEGLLYEVGEDTTLEARAGRKEILLDIDYTKKKLLGIDIESDSVFVGIANLKGDLIDHRELNISIGNINRNNVEDMVEEIYQEAQTILKANKIKESDILSCGIGLVGRMRLLNKTITDDEDFVCDEMIRELVEEKFRVSTAVENNVRALTIAEKEFYSDKTQQNLLFVKIGPGIGSAIIIENSLIDGSTGIAGELGQCIVNKDNGHIVTLEELIRIETLRVDYEGLIQKDNAPYLYSKVKDDVSKITVALIAESYHHEDPFTKSLLSYKLQIIVQHIYNLKIVLDLEKIVFTYNSVYGFFHEIVQREAKRIDVEFSDMISLSEISKRTPYIGGVAVALENFVNENSI